jgi:SAM-dependent methyltransferase
MSDPQYYDLAKHYEKCLAEHNASYKGVDWPNEQDLVKRFEVALEGMRPSESGRVSILDLGCGIGLLVDHLKKKGVIDDYEYWGIDISEKMVTVAGERHAQQRFEVRDILRRPLPSGSADFVLMNGLLTEKTTLSGEVMEDFARRMIKAAFDTCRHGIAFNVMSTHVDWTRDDLFHWPLDSMADFLVAECSRNIVVRMDYGLYEYFVYVYREPSL